MMATTPHRWLVNIGSGNGLVSSGNKQLPANIDLVLCMGCAYEHYVFKHMHNITMHECAKFCQAIVIIVVRPINSMSFGYINQ